MTNHRVLIPVSHPLGGIRTYMLYFFRRLHNTGSYKFTFLSETSNAFDLLKRDFKDMKDAEFIEIPPQSGVRTTLKTIRQAIKSRQFDLIHSQGLKAGTETAAANYFSNIPHLITLHDVIIPQNEIPGRFKHLKRAIISFLTRHVSFIIPVSYDCESNHLQNFPAWRHGPVKVKTILNGIDIERIKQSQSTLSADCNTLNFRGQFDIDSNVILGGFFGRFMHQKGIDVLLKSLELLVDRGYADRFRLIITRDFNGFLDETIKLVTENSKIARMIHFIDPVTDITPLLLGIDVMVAPSRWEACPLLPMESLVLGVPVIGSNCIGLREVLNGTPSLIHENGNPESLATMLIKFIESPTTDAAKQYVSESVKRFDIRSSADQLLEIYQSLCNS
ncbi:MAG: glycosyltransferase family 4 protein [Planctomycetaceae bacterium]|jgi:glycosyltransferase involved in cell wall biosynthesis|nr:glycosyltransferase family 4 protein [Planctomycetaceae bacterium]